MVESVGQTVTLLRVERAQAAEGLSRLQVTVGSTLGALAWHTGGVVA
jgi:Protein of unknown function DUF2625